MEDITKTGPKGLEGLKGINRINKMNDKEYNQFLSSFSSPTREGVRNNRLSTLGEEFESSTGYDVGSSIYDKEIYNSDEILRVNDIRAENLPWYSLLAAGVGKGAVLAGTTFLDGTVGLLYGSLSALANIGNDKETGWETFSRVWDNEISNGLQEINKLFEEYMPNYYTLHELDTEWYKRLGTVNFWADGVLKNLGFMVGAMYSGSAWNKVLKLSNILKETSTMGARISGSLMSAVNEGRIEANLNSSDLKELEYKKLLDAYNRKYKEIISDNTINLEEAINELDANFLNLLSLIDERVAKAGAIDLLENIPILAFDNLMTYSKLYSRGFSNARDVAKLVAREGATKKKGWLSGLRLAGREGLKEEAKDASHVAYENGKYIAKKATAGDTWKSVIKTGIREGNEELAQQMAANIAGNLYTLDGPDAYYEALKKPDSQLKSNELIASVTKAFADSYGDGDLWEQFAVGAISSLLGMPTFGRVNNSDANTVIGKNKPIGWSGGIIGEFKTASALNKEAEAKAATMNKTLERLRLHQRHYAQANTFTDAMDGFSEENDKFEYKNAEDNLDFSSIEAFASAGRLDDLKALVSQDFENISDEELAKIAEFTSKSDKDGKPVGGWRNADGTLMSDTEDGRAKMREELAAKRDDTLKKIDLYALAIQTVRAIGNNSLTDELNQELAWLLWKLNQFSDRFNSIKEENKETFTDFKAALLSWEDTLLEERKYLHQETKKNEKGEIVLDEDNEDTKTFTENSNMLTNIRAAKGLIDLLLSSKSPLFLASYLKSNPEFSKMLRSKEFFDFVELMSNKSGLDYASYSKAMQDLVDTERLAKAAEEFNNRYKQFTSDPMSVINDRQKKELKEEEKVQAQNEARDNVNKKDKVNNAKVSDLVTQAEEGDVNLDDFDFESEEEVNLDDDTSEDKDLGNPGKDKVKEAKKILDTKNKTLVELLKLLSGKEISQLLYDDAIALLDKSSSVSESHDVFTDLLSFAFNDGSILDMSNVDTSLLSDLEILDLQDLRVLEAKNALYKAMSKAKESLDAATRIPKVDTVTPEKDLGEVGHDAVAKGESVNQKEKEKEEKKKRGKRTKPLYVMMLDALPEQIKNDCRDDVYIIDSELKKLKRKGVDAVSAIKALEDTPPMQRILNKVPDITPVRDAIVEWFDAHPSTKLSSEQGKSDKDLQDIDGSASTLYTMLDEAIKANSPLKDFEDIEHDLMDIVQEFVKLRKLGMDAIDAIKATQNTVAMQKIRSVVPEIAAIQGEIIKWWGLKDETEQGVTSEEVLTYIPTADPININTTQSTLTLSNSVNNADSEGAYNFWKPTTTEVPIHWIKGDFTPYYEVAEKLKNADGSPKYTEAQLKRMKAVYEYLLKLNAWDNAFHVKEGDTVNFVIDPTLEQEAGEPVILMQVNGQIVGDVMSINDSASGKLVWLTDFINRVILEYNALGIPDFFISKETSKVSKKMVGKVPFTELDDRHTLNEIHTTKDSTGATKSVPFKLGVYVGNGRTLMTPGRRKELGASIEEQTVIAPLDAKAGTPLLLMPTGSAKRAYMPVTISMKRYTPSNPINARIYKAIDDIFDKLITLKEGEEVKWILELLELLSIPEMHLNFTGDGKIKLTMIPIGENKLITLYEGKQSPAIVNAKLKLENTPFQISRKYINTTYKDGSDYNSMIGELAETNVEVGSTHTISSWFTVNPLNALGQMEKAKNPKSTKTNPTSTGTQYTEWVHRYNGGSMVLKVDNKTYEVFKPDGTKVTGAKAMAYAARTYIANNKLAIPENGLVQTPWGIFDTKKGEFSAAPAPLLTTTLSVNKGKNNKEQLSIEESIKFVEDKIYDKLIEDNLQEIIDTLKSEIHDIASIIVKLRDLGKSLKDTHEYILGTPHMEKIKKENKFFSTYLIDVIHAYPSEYSSKTLTGTPILVGDNSLGFTFTETEDVNLGDDVPPTNNTKTPETVDLKPPTVTPKKEVTLAELDKQAKSLGLMTLSSIQTVWDNLSMEDKLAILSLPKMKAKNVLNAANRNFDSKTKKFKGNFTIKDAINPTRNSIATQYENDYEKWDEKQETEWLNKVLPQLSNAERLKIVKSIIRISDSPDGVKAWGQFKSGIIYISKNAAKGTMYHEAFHAVVHTLMSDNEVNTMFSEAAKKWGNIDEIALEENLAESFRRYVLLEETPVLGKVVKIFRTLKHMIRSIMGKEVFIDELFYRINRGKLSDRTPGDTTFNAYMSERGLEYYLNELDYYKEDVNSINAEINRWNHITGEFTLMKKDSDDGLIKLHYVGKETIFGHAAFEYESEANTAIKQSKYRDLLYTLYNHGKYYIYAKRMTLLREEKPKKIAALRKTLSQALKKVDEMQSFIDNNKWMLASRDLMNSTEGYYRKVDQYYRDAMDYGNLDAESKLYLSDRGVTIEEYQQMTLNEKEVLLHCKM